uniref:Uncharacterized protein n=1 Tax=Lactuca sativa TaxID=4236 RepID=A0A9R1W8J3_LACSA|nr:hypothetical protein LSAT_V11C200059720 [Lactuca sativa]
MFILSFANAGMDMSTRETSNQNHDDAFSSMTIKTDDVGDFYEMEWVPFQYTGDENEVAFFLSDLSHGAAAKPESWGSEPGRYVVFEGGGKGRFFIAVQWYFPHECLNVNLLHDA